MMTKAETLCQAVDDYLAVLPPGMKPDLKKMEGEILERTHALFDVHNSMCEKNQRWKKPDEMNHLQIRQAIIRLFCIRKINMAGSQASSKDAMPLAIYQPEGKNAGTYQTDDMDLESLIYTLSPNATIQTVENVMRGLRGDARIQVVECMKNPDLVAVNNGIFDFRTKQLLPFSEEAVFLTKCPVNYVPNAPMPVIHDPSDNTDWDPESWMKTLSDDPEIVELLWQIIGAVIRPGVRWNKAAWLYSPAGNNGKGTLCSLMRSLCGDGNHASIALEDFSAGGFSLEPLMHASAIIVDENNVGVYIDKSKELKAVITGDCITVNRKFKAAVNFQFRGFMVQCLNEYPKIRDRSSSFLRRCLIIPMEKCFTGTEKPYIKTDYLMRRETLEYVLCRVLNMDYYELSAPESCMAALEDYQDTNDPVRLFLKEMLPRLAWDVVPFEFLYDLYNAWLKMEIPTGAPLSSRVFKNEVALLLRPLDNPFGYHCPDKRAKIWVPLPDRFKPEPLSSDYGLTRWLAPRYSGSNKMQASIASADMRGMDYIRGIKRIPGSKADPDAGNPAEAEGADEGGPETEDQKGGIS